MAKRKRLDPAPFETKSMDPHAARVGAPVAHVAGDAAGSAALRELADFLTDARADGRLIEALPLDLIDAGHLVRDRLIGADALQGEEMQALIASLRARGQQVPLDVVELADGRYGLVSGLRRITALRHLAAETGEARFAEAHVRVVDPGGMSGAYLSMVEENEIRAGLSFYERARIVVKAAEAGAFADEAAALADLFGNVSRAKRSKVRSFTFLVAALDDALRFPAALSEKRGLALVKALQRDEGLAGRLVAALAAAAPGDAQAEQAVIDRTVATGRPPAAPPAPTPGPPVSDASDPAEESADPAVDTSIVRAFSGDAARDRGVVVESARDEIVLRGPGVDAELVSALISWLGARGFVSR